MSIISLLENKILGLEDRERKLKEATNLLEELPKKLTHKIMVKLKKNFYSSL